MRHRGALLALGIVSILATPVRASIFDLLPEALQAGGMSRLPGDQSPDKRRTVLLNGFPMTVQIGRTQQPVTQVLDHYQALYKGGALGEIMKRPISVRHEGPQGGSLVSVEVPDRATALKVAAMEQSLLSAGPLRMVHARRNGLNTDYLIISSDRALPATVFGGGISSQDAPGQDPPGVPRPQGPRIFSFVEPKAGYRLAIYQVESPPEPALREVAARMGGVGYTEDASFGAAAARQGKRVARFTKDQQDVVVTARTAEGAVTQLVYLTRDLS